MDWAVTMRCMPTTIQEPYEVEVDPWKDENASEPKIFKDLVALKKLSAGIDILTALAHVGLEDTSLVKRLLPNLEYLHIRGYQVVGNSSDTLPSFDRLLVQIFLMIISNGRRAFS